MTLSNREEKSDIDKAEFDYELSSYGGNSELLST